MTARLQATPAFPPVADYLTVLESLLGRLLGSGLFIAGLLDRHQEGFERIRQAYPWDSGALVSSHNDPHPGNILFDGKRLWLIDWETAYRNDPLVDVAIFTLYLAGSPELEGLLLQSWLGRAPDRALRARLVLMRQLVRLFYGCAASLHAAAPGVVPETDLTALTPAAVPRRRRRGTVGRGRTGDPAHRRQGGTRHLPGRPRHAGVRGSARRRPAGLTSRRSYPRSTLPALASLSLPCSQVTAPLTTVYSTPREGMTMRLAPPGRS